MIEILKIRLRRQVQAAREEGTPLPAGPFPSNAIRRKLQTGSIKHFSL